MNDYPFPINENIMCMIKEKNVHHFAIHVNKRLELKWTFQVKNKLKYDTTVKCVCGWYYCYIPMSLLVQENPSPVYPVLQEQVWLPSVLLQVA